MAETVKDPVCGMDIDPAIAAGKSEYKGQTYYFCSLGCKKSFDKDPEKYLGQGQHENHHQNSVPSRNIYPIHPIRQANFSQTTNNCGKAIWFC